MIKKASAGAGAALQRCAVLLLAVFFLSPAVQGGERGEIGLRLRQEGVAWRIVAIAPGHAADKAGLEVGDVVIRIGNLSFPSEDQLRQFITGLKPGESVRVSVIGDGGPVDYELTAEP